MNTWTSAPIDFDLDGKVVVITGGSRGMGLAMARGAHAAGAAVVAVAQDPDRLRSVAEEAGAAGARIQTVAADLADDDERARAFAEIVDRHGRIDGLVNNAGVTKVAPSIDYDLADLRRILEVNVTAVFACAQAAARAMPEGGAIVNTASLSSFIGQPERAAYVASKTAVLGLTRALAVEWGERGIRVNAIAPGYIETDITADLLRRGVLDRSVIEGRTPVRRFGTPEDVVGATLFLLSDASSFVSGATLSIDGGWLANGYIR
jgi:NAD(P)-dependent dehydrogenase (short-subunit alcohol dehydrogenase family)